MTSTRPPTISRELEDAAGKGFMATNWMEQNKALFHALRLERLVTFITIGLIVFVAALNILISLIMMVMEKTKDIAVLMSMGTRKAQVRNVFIAQGVVDWRDRNGDRPGARLCDLLCWGPLPRDFAVAGSLFDRLCAVRPAAGRRRLDRRVHCAGFVCGDSVSVVVGVANPAGGGAPL